MGLAGLRPSLKPTTSWSTDWGPLHIPIMFNSLFLNSRGATFALELVNRLCEEVPGVMAMKDDVGGELARKICLRTHDSWVTSAGGQKQNHMNLHPYGVDGYLSTFIKFKPEIAWQYWNAIQANDLEAARGVIRDYDIPLFEYLLGLEGGFNAGIYGILELRGLTTRYRRAPYHALTDLQMEKLTEFVRERKIL